MGESVMKKFIMSIMLGLSVISYSNVIVNPSVVMADDIDKILKAKDIVRAMVNFPDTLVFHEFHTLVKGNTVTLKFTCKNAFGVPETHTLDIKVN
jgi:hypothetical protein